MRSKCEPRFALRETVLVDLADSTYVGQVVATEPGENLRVPIAGTAYHVWLPGHDSLAPRVVIVAESALSKLTETD